MATYNRYTYLATIGDLPVKEAGQPVILPGDTNDVWNVLAGELVVWDKQRNITLGVDEIATSKHISIGVGQGSPGELATDILHIAGEDFNLCKGEICTNVTKPSCGCPQVVDVFFDCTKCNDVYTIALHLDDSRIRSQYGFNEKAEYVFSIPTECCTCDDCDPEHNCEEVACAFVDAINGKVQRDPSKITYFQKANLADQYQPFTASRIFNKDNSRKIFCISPSDTECKDCAHLPGITGIIVDGVQTDFTFTTKPGDTSVTLHGQMERVVSQANKAIEAVGGGAYLTPGDRACCPYNITVNTCADSVQFIVDGAPVDPCEEYNPFTAQIKESVCKGCGASPEEVNLNCGFSILVDPLDVPCDCKFPPNMAVPNYYGRTIEPAFAGDGWVCHNHYWTEAQEQKLPAGYGYFWQDKAHYGQHNGGTARDWRYSNRRVGRIGLPDAHSRASNAANLIKCDETYCVYNITSTDRDHEWFNNAVRHYNTDVSYVLVPEKDTQTKSTWEPILAALQARGICCPGDIACGVTDDEIDTGDAVVGTAVSIDVSENDTTYCEGTVTYNVLSSQNATVEGDGPSFDVTPEAEGEFAFIYEVLCDDVKIGEATVTGLAVSA